MSAKTYRKKPVTVEAIQWKGGNFREIVEYVGSFVAEDGIEEPGVRTGIYAQPRIWVAANREWLDIEIGEWVLKDKLGFYPCKDEMFQHSYELVEP